MSDNDWHQQETYRSLMEYGQATLKFVFLANGGSAVALLSYMASVNAKGIVAPDVKWPMIVFLIGVFLGGCATTTAYLTQLALFNEAYGREAPGRHIYPLNITLGMAIAGVSAFLVGALWAACALST